MSGSSLILSIDTHHSSGSIAIGSEDELLGLLTLQTKLSHTKRLLSGIQFLLEQLQICIGEISTIAVNTGPGSFTGLRIGLSVVKGLAFPTKAKILSFDTNTLLAFPKILLSSYIASLLDAGRNEVYFRFFEKKKSSLKILSDLLVLAPKDIMQHINQQTSQVLLVGNGALRYKKLLLDMGFSKIERGETMLAKTMLEMAYTGEGTEISIDSLDVLYIRRADAELKKTD